MNTQLVKLPKTPANSENVHKLGRFCYPAKLDSEIKNCKKIMKLFDTNLGLQT